MDWRWHYECFYKKSARKLKFNTKTSIITHWCPDKNFTQLEQGTRKASEWTIDLIIDRLIRIKLEEENRFVDDELKVLSFITIKNKVHEIAKDYDVKKIYLFGSYVKGEVAAVSDIDLYMESSLNGLDYFGFVERLRTTLHKKIDLLSNITVKPNSLIAKEIKKTGVLIYER